MNDGPSWIGKGTTATLEYSDSIDRIRFSFANPSEREKNMQDVAGPEVEVECWPDNCSMTRRHASFGRLGEEGGLKWFYEITTRRSVMSAFKATLQG